MIASHLPSIQWEQKPKFRPLPLARMDFDLPIELLNSFANGSHPHTSTTRFAYRLASAHTNMK